MPNTSPTPKAFTQNRSGNGTKQWSDVSYNICKGCSHDCIYCYAKSMAWRFAGGNLNWSAMVVDPQKVAKAARKFPGVVMFPTSHDITPAILPACLTTLKNMLSHGNYVLIVTKPHLSVIKTICQQLLPYQDQILFRFTIGSPNSAVCQLWEPGAPSPIERIEALKYAYQAGYHTSVSMEPMLGTIPQMIRLVRTVSPYVSDTIWLGKMNGAISTKNLLPPLGSQIQAAKQALATAHSDQNIMRLVRALQSNPKVQWKNSILAVIAQMASAPVASTAPAAPPANKISITSVPSKPMVMVIIINKRAAKKIP